MIAPGNRQVVIDTETTGLEVSKGHRVIEIGCVEMVGRVLTGRTFHTYLQPDRRIDPGAEKVHGISNDSLRGKPHFMDVARSFLDFINGAELIAHNAPFDIGFLNAELALLGEKWRRIQDYCPVTDTVPMARKQHPGKRVTLDHLCEYYGVDRSSRSLHGALLDAQLLAQVYLLMTSVQTTLFTDDERPGKGKSLGNPVTRIAHKPLKVIRATAEEEAAHQAMMQEIEKASGHKTAWPDEDAAEIAPESVAASE